MSINYGFFVPHPPIIVPEIGHGQEHEIQDTIDAYNEVGRKIAEIAPETIIISSPHSTVYGDYFHISPHTRASGDLGQFGARKIRFDVDYDGELRDSICDALKAEGIPSGTDGERIPELDHGVIIPLYFIKKYYQNFKIIRLSPSGMGLIDHYRYGQIVNELVQNKKVVWIASGDLSHKLKHEGPYGIVKEGPEFDKIFIESSRNGEFLKILQLDPEFYQKAAECGLGSFAMMAGLFDGYDVSSELLSYQGNFGVGYGILTFARKAKNPKRNFKEQYQQQIHNQIAKIRQGEDEYVALARQSLEYFLENHKVMPLPENLSPELLNHKAGVFVTLYKHGNLRGCIGTIKATTDSIAKEIINNAVSSGVRDYRFSPVKPHEKNDIVYSVDVLTDSTPVTSFLELDPQRYGVIVRSGHKSGLLLPGIEGVDTVEDQIRIACRKAGITHEEDYKIEKFEVIRHH